MKWWPAGNSHSFVEFFESEKNSAIILFLCVVFALLLANSIFAGNISSFFHSLAFIEYGIIKIDFTIENWINDGLMTIFFLLVGLEIERELYIGELSNFKAAALPIISALGGMVIPASIYMLFNQGTVSQNGVGIPMATDIAFALGVISLLGKRININLKIFLAAFAIIDDIGSISFLAIFYSHSISAIYLLISLSIIAILIIMNRAKVYFISVYLILGIVLWYCLAKAGIHPTISGVIVAFSIPYSKGAKNPSLILQKMLEIPVAFMILPLFAFANTGIKLDVGVLKNMGGPYAAGIIGGLIIGKPVGIVIFTLLGVKMLGLRLPSGANWVQVIGIGCLGGIGFTMSIFMTNIAFSDIEIIRNAKVYILLASVTSGIIGYFVLRKSSNVSS